PNAPRTTRHGELRYNTLLSLKTHDIRFRDQIRKLDGVHESRVQRFEVGLCHPTGDAAGPSNKNGHFGLNDFRDQFRKGRKPDAVNVSLPYRTSLSFASP